VGLQHAAKVTELESALSGSLREAGCKGRIIEDSCKFSGKRHCISSAKREPAFAENLHKGPKVGGDHRKASQHIFGNDQAENFSTQGWNHDHGCFRESSIEFRP
jgi:hypothetical protein